MSVYSNNKYNKKEDNDAWSKVFGLIPDNSKILDIGCSSGNLGAALKQNKKGLYIVGIDMDEPDVKLASKNLDEAYVHNVEQDNLEKLGTFDVIIMADVIEHLLDPVSALKKIKKLLKPNGRLVFSIPNMANLTTRIELLRGRFEYKDFGLLDRTHLHFYDHKEVNRVFADAGLVVKKTDCTVRDVPDKIMKEELAAIGVKLTPEFKKHLYNTEALVYQFIGYAQVGTPKKSADFSTTSHLDSVSRSIDAMTRDFDSKIQVAKAEAHNAKQEAEAARKELQAILTSKGWKMLEKLHTVKHHTNRLLKPHKK